MVIVYFECYISLGTVSRIYSRSIKTTDFDVTFSTDWLNLADVITFDLRCSVRIEVKNSSVCSLPVKYLIHLIKQLPLVGK